MADATGDRPVVSGPGPGWERQSDGGVLQKEAFEMVMVAPAMVLVRQILRDAGAPVARATAPR
jgi:hypothetical protein